MPELIPDESWVFEEPPEGVAMHCHACGAFFGENEQAEDDDGCCIECGSEDLYEEV